MHYSSVGKVVAIIGGVAEALINYFWGAQENSEHDAIKNWPIPTLELPGCQSKFLLMKDCGFVGPKFENLKNYEQTKLEKPLNHRKRFVVSRN
jgi:hypothetical protein